LDNIVGDKVTTAVSTATCLVSAQTKALVIVEVVVVAEEAVTSVASAARFGTHQFFQNLITNKFLFRRLDT
jgi:hypothetical protein